MTRGRGYLATALGPVEAAIPLGEIAAYCALFGIADPDEFVPLIRAMDEAYLGARAERRATASRKD